MGATDLGLIPSRVKPMFGILKFPVWRSARDSVKNKPASCAFGKGCAVGKGTWERHVLCRLGKALGKDTCCAVGKGT